MSFRLVDEVLDQAPADLTLAERIALIAIASHAQEHDRRCWPSIELLAEETGMSPDHLRKAFGRLAQRGLEVRVAITHTGAGRPVYAYPGRRTIYSLPTFPRRPPASDRADERRAARAAIPRANGGPDGTPNAQNGGPHGTEWRPSRAEMASRTGRPEGKEPERTGEGVPDPIGERCARHANVPAGQDPGPCRGCMRARQTAENAAKAAAAARVALARDCPWCDGTNWIENADGSPARKCNHRPALEAVTG